ncbi:MAG TPA: hypothetical protein VM735_09680 [Candidatus Kapabacteria bacterium]|nr:hypothetical protein [Candidatus Kapabacteria bacterium]
MRFVLLSILFSVAALRAEVLYLNDFQKSDAGSVPDDLMVIEGQFAVKEADGNKVLELPGAPLDTFSFLFGPKESTNIAVQARIFATAKGRRYTVFDVGLGGLGGYKLRVAPAKKQLELYRGDELKTSVPLQWTPAKWTSLKLEVQPADPGKWNITGKLWQDGAEEPKEPTLTFSDTQAPPRERASAGAMPYSGDPVLFDDLTVTRVK